MQALMVMLVILLLNMLSCESRLRCGGYFLARLFPVDLGDLSECFATSVRCCCALSMTSGLMSSQRIMQVPVDCVNPAFFQCLLNENRECLTEACVSGLAFGLGATHKIQVDLHPPKHLKSLGLT